MTLLLPSFRQNTAHSTILCLKDTICERFNSSIKLEVSVPTSTWYTSVRLRSDGIFCIQSACRGKWLRLNVSYTLLPAGLSTDGEEIVADTRIPEPGRLRQRYKSIHFVSKKKETTAIIWVKPHTAYCRRRAIDQQHRKKNEEKNLPWTLGLRVSGCGFFLSELHALLTSSASCNSGIVAHAAYSTYIVQSYKRLSRRRTTIRKTSRHLPNKPQTRSALFRCSVWRVVIKAHKLLGPQ